MADILQRIEEKHSQSPRDIFHIMKGEGMYWNFRHEFITIGTGGIEVQKRIEHSDYQDFCKEVMEYLK